MKGRINELETNNKKIGHLYIGINEFQNGYKIRISIIKNESDIHLLDPQNVLNRCKNFFNQVLNVHGIHNISKMVIHMAKPLVPAPSLVEMKIAIGKLKSYTSPGTDQISAELIRAGGETYSEVHRIICFI
jgi:hypothetical protein